MKLFNIYEHPQGTYEAIKQGVSWPAFFFTFIWAFVKKMWRLGIGTCVLLFISGIIVNLLVGEGSKSDVLNHVIGLIIATIFGINVNRWRESKLISKGFKFKDTVAATTPKKAIVCYINVMLENKNPHI